jgi:hypothetical protein
VGEKKVGDEDCFILKLSADAETLRQRSEGPAEIIRHVLFGYFSQRTGLLVHVEDSHLTRIQPHAGGDAVYWETTISSFLEDYRAVDDGGVVIAHAGRSAVTLFRFGEMAMSHTKTRMEEAWTIQEAAFNVPGLSTDCFIPPADIRRGGDSVEAAKVDGASHARIFFTMTLRLVMPILVTVFMLGFVGLYSEFILASIFLRDVDSQTLSVGLYSMTVGNERNRLFGQFATGALLASLPVVVLYLGAQRYLVGGLTQGSVK